LLLEHRGKTDAALAAFRRADERGDRLGAVRLGLLLARQGKWDPARAAWERADARTDPADAGLDLAALLEQERRLAEPLAGPPSRPAPLAYPVVIGAMTVLAVVIGVFLAYSANQGLPFLPTRELKVLVPDGSQLAIGNDVREGGYRIGLVSDARPVRAPGGRVLAELVLKLDRSHGAVPVDSSVTIRTRSVLGLKYVELNRGSSTRLVPDGGTISSPHAVPVGLDQIFSMFDPRTRRAIKRDLTGFGDTFAGRGIDLNETVASLPALFRHLTPVAAYLSAPQTGLTRFLRAIDATTGAIAPVAASNSRLFTDLATTLAAIVRDPNALQRTIGESPPTLDVATDSLRAQRPFLTDLAQLGRSLTPATVALRDALPAVNAALIAGAHTLSRTPPLNARLQQVMRSLRSLALAPGTNVAVNALAATTRTLNPMLRYLGPFQTVCDSWNHWWTDLSEHLSEKTSFGFAERVLLMAGNPIQPNNVDAIGASAPVAGGGVDTPLSGNEFLHSQQYGAAVDRAGHADCETGQRGYPLRLSYYDPQHRNIVVDPHTPGDQGPTFTGRTRVPRGETFSRQTQQGPGLPDNPSNP
jgi:ABC-type transporter Mla subunit MlaD